MTGIEARNTLDAGRIPELRRLYSETWWAADRDHDCVTQIVAGSDLVFALIDVSQDQLVAFARVLTDAAYIALLLDVIVLRDRRGTGLGRMLMDTVIAHPTIASVETVELVCPPALGAFYSRWGFVDHSGGSRLLRRTSSHTLLHLDSANG